jgi:hypothetical protein
MTARPRRCDRRPFAVIAVRPLSRLGRALSPDVAVNSAQNNQRYQPYRIGRGKTLLQRNAITQRKRPASLRAFVVAAKRFSA